MMLMTMQMLNVGFPVIIITIITMTSQILNVGLEWAGFPALAFYMHSVLKQLEVWVVPAIFLFVIIIILYNNLKTNVCQCERRHQRNYADIDHGKKKRRSASLILSMRWYWVVDIDCEKKKIIDKIETILQLPLSGHFCQCNHVDLYCEKEKKIIESSETIIFSFPSVNTGLLLPLVDTDQP